MGEVALDIETVADTAAVARALSNPPTFKAPGNYKDEEKIAANKAEQVAKWAAGVRNKAALSERTGRVAAYGLYSDGDTPVEEAWGSEHEYDILKSLSEMLSKHYKVITFNGSGFDIRFIRNRMVKYGIVIPTVLWPESPWAYQSQFDVRSWLTGGDRRATGTLSDWCASLDIDPPVPHTAKQIQEMHDNCGFLEMRDIVLQDARCAWEIYRRIKVCL